MEKKPVELQNVVNALKKVSIFILRKSQSEPLTQRFKKDLRQFMRSEVNYDQIVASRGSGQTLWYPWAKPFSPTAVEHLPERAVG